MHIEEGNAAHLLKTFCSKPQCHSHKRIISSGGTDGIELVLNPLPALVKVAVYLVIRVLFSPVLCMLPLRVHIFQKFFFIFSVAFLCIRGQNLIHLRHRETAVLLGSGAQDNIPHNVKCGVQCLRLVVPDIAHLKSAL